jgi:outer membrane protein assembly factor BamB
MKSSACVSGRKLNVVLRIVLSIVTIGPLWLTLGAASTSADAQATSSPADWTQFHRDNMQRWDPYETVLGVNSVGGLQLKWKNTIGNFGGAIQSSPAVVNGVIYSGSDGGNVYALNASTGVLLWSFSTNGYAVSSSPAVANGIVYVGSGDGNVYALNASTGGLLWSYGVGAFPGVESSPAVVNGVVYVSSYEGNVYALNASTGAKLWSSDTGAIIYYSSPAVANGVVYACNGTVESSQGPGIIVALNASTGAKLWSYDTGASIGVSSPAVANGVVYVGSDNGNVYALNASTGALLWKYTTGSYVYSSPAVANGVVYIGSGDGNVYALNASTGAKLWSYTAGDTVISSPAVANGVVYVASSYYSGRGILYALNASTGAKLWSYSVESQSSAPTIVDGTVYMRAGNLGAIGNTYAFALGKPADLFLRIFPSTTTVHQGDLLTYAFPVWNLGPGVAEGEVLSNLQVPAGTTFDYIRISGTPGLGTCTHPPYGGTGQIICHEGDGMAPNTTWTVRLTVKVTAAAGSTITANAATMADTPDPNLANNMATVSLKVQ